MQFDALDKTRTLEVLPGDLGMPRLALQRKAL